ncbi:MAG: hypothetical protein SVR94_04765, partial [Pseudomonadota bacterium]|nr:hypothetical protein [Pseudomonadota bacterium]
RGYDIESLHSHPVTKALYAASAINAKNGGGYLYQIDKSTGIMETLGTISLMNAEPVNNISGVAFNPTTNSFWGWVKSQGLFRLTLEEPIELKAELKLASQAKVEDLTWNAEGNMLYLAQGNQIWHYDGNQMNAVCSLASQKQKIEALESSSDGTLLLSIHGDTTIYQLDSQALAQNTQCPIQAFVSTPFDDIEGMAWVCTLQ